MSRANRGDLSSSASTSTRAVMSELENWSPHAQAGASSGGDDTHVADPDYTPPPEV